MIDALERAVSDLLGEACTAVERLSYEGGTFLVARVRRADGSTVVAKWTDAPNGPLINERATLEAIAGTPAAAVVPRVVAGSSDATLLVTSDLAFTREQRLGAILEGDDPDAAESALLAHMEALARLHRSTTGSTARALAERLEAAAPLTLSRHGVHHLDENLARFSERLGEITGEAPDIADEIEEARATLRDPGPLLCVSHGDGTAANSCVQDGAARLFDFETGAPRHALVDGCFPQLRYVFSVWAKGFPENVRHRAMHRYRRELGANDADHAAGEVAACAAWTALTVKRSASVRASDVRYGRSGWRARIVAALDHLNEVTDRTGRMPRTGAAAHAAAETLRELWPAAETRLPLHRAWSGRRL